METITDQPELGEVLDLAQRYLDRHQPADYRLQVLPKTVQRDEDWYYITVDVSRDDVPSYDYNHRLAEAETELHEREGRKFLFIPALPKD